MRLDCFKQVSSNPVQRLSLIVLFAGAGILLAWLVINRDVRLIYFTDHYAWVDAEKPIIPGLAVEHTLQKRWIMNLQCVIPIVRNYRLQIQKELHEHENRKPPTAQWPVWDDKKDYGAYHAESMKFQELRSKENAWLFKKIELQSNADRVDEFSIPTHVDEFDLHAFRRKDIQSTITTLSQSLPRILEPGKYIPDLISAFNLVGLPDVLQGKIFQNCVSEKQVRQIRASQSVHTDMFGHLVTPAKVAVFVLGFAMVVIGFLFSIGYHFSLWSIDQTIGRLWNWVQTGKPDTTNLCSSQENPGHTSWIAKHPHTSFFGALGLAWLSTIFVDKCLTAVIVLGGVVALLSDPITHIVGFLIGLYQPKKHRYFIINALAMAVAYTMVFSVFYFDPMRAEFDLPPTNFFTHVMRVIAVLISAHLFNFIAVSRRKRKVLREFEIGSDGL